jgi:phosphohistidine swiveling domain-containing protein
MKEVLNIDWKKRVRRNTNYLLSWFFYKGASTQFDRVLGIKNKITYFRRADKELFYSESEVNKMVKEFRDGFENDNRYLHKLLKRGYALCEELNKLGEEMENKDFSDYSNKHLSELFSKVEDIFLGVGPLVLQVLALEPYLEEELNTRLKKLLDKRGLMNKFEEYSALIKTPIRENSNVFEAKNILRIAIKIKNNEYLLELFEKDEKEILENLPEELRKDIKNYLKDYSWVPTRGGHVNKELKGIQVISRLKELVKQDCENKLRQIENEKIENELKEVLEEIKPDDKFLIFIDALRNFIHLRTHRTDTIYRNFFGLKGFFTEIAKRLSLEVLDITHMNPEEIINLLKFMPSDLEERRKDFDYLMMAGDLRSFTGKELEEHRNLFKKEDYSHIKELKGTTANPGYAKGIAKVFHQDGDTSKVNKGDILIAFMTNASFVAAMDKAAAFVTNEGGILCHASILAREMGKPCVIGTDIATKVFKDGDLVEVDAEKGIVRRLK